MEEAGWGDTFAPHFAALLHVGGGSALSSFPTFWMERLIGWQVKGLLEGILVTCGS
jgi:hypothetical protein